MLNKILNTLRQNLGRINGGYILAYHHIAPDLFIEQINVLHPDIIVPLDELINRKVNNQSTKGLFAITVDDGYNNTIPRLCDICIEKGWPITFYPLIDFLDGKIMIWLLLQNLKKILKGHTISIAGKQKDFKKRKILEATFDQLQLKIYTLQKKEYMHIIDSIIESIIDNNIAQMDELYNQPKSITWDFVEEKSKNELISFQSHGVTHMPVIALSNEKIEKECVKSKKRISDVTGKKSKPFLFSIW